MEDITNIAILVTAENEEEAHLIAYLLLKQHRAACVNIVPRVSSVFRWQNKLDTPKESMLIIKTRASLLNEVIELVKTAHSYDVPEIIALPIIGGNPDYLDWIGTETE